MDKTTETDTVELGARALLLGSLEEGHGSGRLALLDLYEFPAFFTPLVQDLLQGVRDQRHAGVFPFGHGSRASLVDPPASNLIHVTQRLTHASSGVVLAERIRWARSIPARARGLIGSRLDPLEGLILQPGNQVHTFFMSTAIDVVFCDQDWRVLHVVPQMPPWRITQWVRGARYVIELPPGAASGVELDDALALVESSVGT